MSKKTKTTTGPSKFSQPYITDAANGLQSAVSGNAGNLSAISSGISGYLPGLGQQVFGQNPDLQAAQGYNQNVLGGQYLNNNPFMDQMIQRSNQEVGDQVNGQFGLAGRTGGGANQAVLADRLSANDLGIRYQNYAQERQNQQQAAGQAPSLYSSQFAGIPGYSLLAGQAAQLPYLGAQTLASGTAGLMGNYNTTTQSPGLGAILMAHAQAAAQAAAAGGGG